MPVPVETARPLLWTPTLADLCLPLLSLPVRRTPPATRTSTPCWAPWRAPSLRSWWRWAR